MKLSARWGKWCVFPLSVATVAPAAQVVAWGDQTNVPPGLDQVVAISAGWNHNLAVTGAGRMLEWGNDPGTPPDGLSNVVAVAASLRHSLALTRDGTVLAWGVGSWEASWQVPTGLSNAMAISANGDSDGVQSTVLRNDGTVVAWGNVTSPSGLSNVVAVAAGTWHNVALKNDGTVFAWGDDTYGQTDVPAGLSNVVAIAGGDFFSLALKADGTVVAWGFDGDGETDVPADLTNVVAIAAGVFHGLALKSDGTVRAWGATYPPLDSGQARVPAGLSNVVVIAGGAGHSLAISSPLEIASIELTNRNSMLRFHTFSGQQYTVQYSPDLTAGSWTDLLGGTVGGNGRDALVMDTNVLATVATRFYRIKQLP